MAGILDSKTRIIDAYLTKAGRDQISTGKLRIEFASFTDRNAFYEASPVSGSTDASTRIYFEASSTDADQVTFETDDSGHLINYTGGSLQLIDGVLIDATGSFVTTEFVTSQSLGFASLSANLLMSSSKNFSRLQLIGTDHPFSGDEFILNKNFINFSINESYPISDTISYDPYATDPATLSPIFLDNRFGHFPAFKFLPPRLPLSSSAPASSLDSLSSDEISELTLGETVATFRNLNQPEITTYDDLSTGWASMPKINLEALEENNMLQEILFEKTSLHNNIVLQLFEIQSDQMGKLDVVDFGEFVDENGISRHVFFAGKTVIDEIGTPSFLNIFTMVFES